MSDLINLKKSKSTTKRLIYLIIINTFSVLFQKCSDWIPIPNEKKKLNILGHVNHTSRIRLEFIEILCVRSEIIYLLVWRTMTAFPPI